jgi:hypothetical protein
MAETAHIAEIAEKLSDELFAEFLWTKVGPTNQNWSCEHQEDHGCKTHPSDVVFYYDEPYSQTRTYIQCDLKSYAKDSISKQAIHGAIESLAKQVTCADVSGEWQDLYLHPDVTAEITGLLFVYNHDGEYDKEFQTNLSAFKHENLKIPSDTKIVVLGPEDIFWLDNIRLEIRLLRSSEGKDRLPARKKCEYFYPQLVRKANLQAFKAKAANLEMLTAPWIVLKYKMENGDKDWGVIVFYRRQGSKVEEFMYLIDYLRHYQVLNANTFVQIKVLDSDALAGPMFQKAVQKYIDDIEFDETEEDSSCEDNETSDIESDIADAEEREKRADSDLATLVREIKFSKMQQVASTFSTVELGMDYE